MKDLEGKVIAITGAASGIGRALSLRLNREGSFLALADRDAKGLGETREGLDEANESATFIVDVSNREQVYGFAASAVDAFAKNSRTEHRVDRQTFEEGVKRIEAAWKTSPAEAADAIVRGIRRKASRVLIGSDARSMDLLARLAPGKYDRVIARYLKRTQ
jgi:NAD(P)-dependent dehydrogenase (short-subunit alcohol dehydrogenase family)